MTGYNVNTGLYHASVAFRGLVKNSAWDPDENQIVVNFNVGADLREAIKNTTVNIVGIKAAAISISGMEDVATKATNATATPGRAFTLSGQNLRIAGTDPSVGLVLVSEDGAETPIAADLWVINKPSTVPFILPTGLDEGAYPLRLTTQFSGNNRDLLKKPRTVEKTIYIGTEPPASGGGETTPGGSTGGGDDDEDLFG